MAVWQAYTALLPAQWPGLAPRPPPLAGSTHGHREGGLGRTLDRREEGELHRGRGLEEDWHSDKVATP